MYMYRILGLLRYVHYSMLPFLRISYSIFFPISHGLDEEHLIFAVLRNKWYAKL